MAEQSPEPQRIVPLLADRSPYSKAEDSLSPHLIGLAKSSRVRGWMMWLLKVGVPAVLVAAVYPALDWVTHRASSRDQNVIAIDVKHLKDRAGADAVVDPDAHAIVAPEIVGTLETRLRALEQLDRGAADAQQKRDTALYEHWVSLAAANAEPRAALRAAAAARARAQYRALVDHRIAPELAADMVLETPIPGR